MPQELTPEPPTAPVRRCLLDYHVSLTLPDDIMAIVRTTWYDGNGHPETVDEMVIMEDDDDNRTVFCHVITSAAMQGANISVRSSYDPEELGIFV